MYRKNGRRRTLRACGQCGEKVIDRKWTYHWKRKHGVRRKARMTEITSEQSPAAPRWLTAPATVPPITLEEYGIKTAVPADMEAAIKRSLYANEPIDWLLRDVVWKVITDNNLDMDALWPLSDDYATITTVGL